MLLFQKLSVHHDLEVGPLEILRGGGGIVVSKGKIFTGQYKAKLEFPKGEVVQAKPSVGGGGGGGVGNTPVCEAPKGVVFESPVKKQPLQCSYKL